jgi:hypothetical protein
VTVTTAVYTPIEVNYVPNKTEYTFELEIIGADAFELWYLDADGNRTIASTDRYVVEFNGPPPIYDSGKVTLTRDPPEGTAQLSIERNTPITQLLDFGAFEPFSMNMIEFTLDKHTMICQELAYRKCDALVGTEMTQLISFEAYTPFRANELTFALDKIIAILAEIAGSAEDCRDRPEET